MRKMVCSFFVMLLLVSLSGCGGTKKAQEAYDAIGVMGFSDESILSSNEAALLASMRERREQLLQDKRAEELEALGEEWRTFSAPIREFIDYYDNTARTFFTDAEKSLLTPAELAECSACEAKVTSVYRARNDNALKAAALEWAAFSEPLRAVLDAYQRIEIPSFSDAELTLLVSNTLSKLQILKERAETALEARDAAALTSLASECRSFQTRANNELEQAREKLMNDFVESANSATSLMNVLSLGLTKSSASVDGHKVTFTTQYTVESKNSDESIKSALDSYLELASGVYQGGVDSLKQYIDDICIRVEYKNSAGAVVSYREFK